MALEEAKLVLWGRLSQIAGFGTIKVDKEAVNIWNKVTTLLMN